MSIDSSLLTCISTGGPATTVTWTRGSDEDSLIPVSDNTHVSVLIDATTAQYMHTLIINMAETELLTIYGCSVSNNIPSSAKVIATVTNNGITISLLPICNYMYISLQVFQIQSKCLYPVVSPTL